jgi:hypothetical protein
MSFLGFFVGTRHNVGVGIERRHGSSMTEHGGDRPNVYAALEKPGCRAMPRVVEPRRREAHLTGWAVEGVADRTWIPCVAKRVRKDEPTDLVLFAFA